MDENNITVADIASLRSLLEASCARGTWKATEMSAVGKLYDKLSNFLTEAERQIVKDSQPTQGE